MVSVEQAYMVGHPLLIIDDLGIERNSEFALEQVYNVIDSRYCKMLPLIVTTNLGLNEMKSTDLDTAHQRIYSRILEKPDGWKQGETTIAVTVDASHMPEGFSIAKIEAKAGKDGSW